MTTLSISSSEKNSSTLGTKPGAAGSVSMYANHCAMPLYSPCFIFQNPIFSRSLFFEHRPMPKSHQRQLFGAMLMAPFGRSDPYKSRKSEAPRDTCALNDIPANAILSTLLFSPDVICAMAALEVEHWTSIPEGCVFKSPKIFSL